MTKADSPSSYASKGNAQARSKWSKRIINSTLSAVMVVGLMPSMAWADGTGSATTPTNTSPDEMSTLAAASTLEIATADEWVAFAESVNSGKDYKGSTVTITADIDFSGVTVPVCGQTLSNNFKGTLDGQGHILSNMVINSTAITGGIFGQSRGGTFKNLTIKGLTVNEECNSGEAVAGGLIGLACGATVENVGVEGVITSSYGAIILGGVIGKMGFDSSLDNSASVMESCYFKGTLAATDTGEGEHVVGGLVGYSDADHSAKNKAPNCIYDSYADATITNDGTSASAANIATGGIVGYIKNATSGTTSSGAVANCAFYGTMNNAGSSVLPAGVACVAGAEATLPISADTPCYYIDTCGAKSAIVATDPAYPIEGTGYGIAKTVDELKATGTGSLLETLNEKAQEGDSFVKGSSYPLLSFEDVDKPDVQIDKTELGMQIVGSTVELTADTSKRASDEDFTGEIESYQWSCSVDGATPVNIKGATDASLSYTVPDNVGSVIRLYCAVSYKAKDSTEVKTTMNSVPVRMDVVTSTPAAQPENVVIGPKEAELVKDEGDPLPLAATYDIAETGVGEISYQWYVSDTATGERTKIEGATEQKYYVPADVLPGVKYYFCEVANTFERVKVASALSSAAKITVTSNIPAKTVETATVTPEESTIQQNTSERATLSASYTLNETGGSDAVTYQWYSCDSDGANPQAIEGATESTYIASPQDEVGDNYYFCKVTNTYELTKTSSKDSNVVKVTTRSGVVDHIKPHATLSGNVPNLTVYEIGESLNLEGMALDVVFADDEVETVTFDKELPDGWTTNFSDPLTSSDNGKTLVLTYTFGGKAVTYDTAAEVSNAAVKISVVSAPQLDASGYYQLASANDLTWFAAMVNERGKNDISGRLTADIDLSNATYTPIGRDSVSGESTYFYNGTLDGNDKAITFSNETDFVATASADGRHDGVVGVLGSGKVLNLTVKGSASMCDHSGAIVGEIAGEGTIESCTNDASISAGSWAGGIVGTISSSSANVRIADCVNNGSITATGAFVGGILGSAEDANSDAKIYHCSNNGTISGTRCIGGILGAGSIVINQGANFGSIVALGNDFDLDSSAGGIVGYFYSSEVRNSINVGTVMGNVAGGIVGLTQYATYKNCYNTGSITSTSQSDTYGSGGLCGTYNNGPGDATFTNCYNAGTVSNGEGASGTVAALIGYDSRGASLTNCYYLEGDGVIACGGTKATHLGYEDKTSEQMKAAYFPPLLGDAYKADGRGPAAINNGYPVLGWQKIEETVDVTFDVQDVGTAPETQIIFKGSKATKPADPTAENYDFGGWYAEAACTNVFDFSSVISVNTTIYAKWTVSDAYKTAAKEVVAYQVTCDKEDIGKLANLSDAEKARFGGDADNAYTDAVSKIGAATTTDDVDKAKFSATAASSKALADAETQDAANLDAAKANAKKAIDDQATAGKAEIDGFAYLSGEEKAGLEGDIDAAQTAADGAIDKRKTTADVAAAQKAGAEAIAKVLDAARARNPETRFAACTIDAIADQAWTGSEVKPELVVKDGETTLAEGTDYTVKYENNTELGTATATVTGVGSYQGTREVTFKINKFGGCTITVEDGTLSIVADAAAANPGVLPDGKSELAAWPWNSARGSITKVVIGEGIVAGNSTGRMFASCAKLTEISGLDNLDTANVTDMQYMFHNCAALTSPNLSKFNTASVTTMEGMFDGCTVLSNLDLSNFVTDKVASMSGMFSGCASMTVLDLSRFNTSNVTNMSNMLKGCTSMLGLGLSKLDTSKVTDMSSMFDGCGSLVALNLTSFATDNVTNMSSMFAECAQLKAIYVTDDKWTVEKVTSSADMFANCPSLVGGNNTTWSTNNPTDKTYARIDCGPTSTTPGYLTTTPNFTVDAIESQLYDGNEITPTVKVTVDGVEVSADSYTLSYRDSTGATVASPKNAGHYVVLVTGKDDKCKGTVGAVFIIRKRIVSIMSDSATKKYDGTPLTNENVTLSGDGFIKGEGVVYEFTGSQTEVGESYNYFTTTWKEGTSGDNYTLGIGFHKLVVTKADGPAAPTGLTVIAPTAKGVSSGKIAGVNSTMEWSSDGGTTWTAIGKDETAITGLASGTYLVRIAETATAEMGASASVVVPVVFDVTFDVQGLGKAPGSQVVASGAKAVKPSDPTASNYDFVDWFTDAECTNAFDFNSAITADTTLYAKWTVTEAYKTAAKDAVAAQVASDKAGIDSFGSLSATERASFERDADGAYSDAAAKIEAATTTAAVDEAKVDGIEASKAVLAAAKTRNAENRFAACTVDAIVARAYSGKALEPAVTVREGDYVLAKGIDYEIAYKDSAGNKIEAADLKDAGTYIVVITGKGNYAGAITRTFAIDKREVTLTSADATKAYDGTALTNGEVVASGDGFVAGEGVTCDVTGSQTYVGSSPNAFTYTYKEGTKEGNYDIAKVEGTLTVTSDVSYYDRLKAAQDIDSGDEATKAAILALDLDDVAKANYIVETDAAAASAKGLADAAQTKAELANAITYADSRYAEILARAKGAVVMTAEVSTETTITAWGQEATFKCATNAEGATYAWQWSKDGGKTWKPCTLSDPSEPTYTIEARKFRSDYQYRCVVTAPNGKTATSNACGFDLDVTQVVAWSDLAPTFGACATLSCAATGDVIGYKWQYRKTADGKWHNCTTESCADPFAQTIQVKAKKYRAGYEYRCVVTLPDDTKVRSNAVTLI